MNLYPQLSAAHSRSLCEVLAARSVAELRFESSNEHPSQTYTPVGGTRVRKEELDQVQSAVRALAHECGYPAAQRRGAHGEFDAGCARLLLELMKVVPAESAKPGVWQFLSCVLLPDVVRWRFPGKSGAATGHERFLGGVRNALSRLWWRAYVLEGANGHSAGLRLLDRLTEEELVQLFERPTLVGCRLLTRSTAVSFLDRAEAGFPKRQELMRDAQKRIMRLASFVSFDSLGADEMLKLTTSVFSASQLALSEAGISR